MSHLTDCPKCGWNVWSDKPCPGCAHAAKQAQPEVHTSKPGDLGFYPETEAEGRVHRRIQKRRSRQGCFGS